jgi:ribosomal protein L44E
MEPIICDTVADFPPEKYQFRVRCHVCQHSAALSNLDPSVRIDRLRLRLTCSQCGSKETGLNIIYHGQSTPDFGRHWIVE